MKSFSCFLLVILSASLVLCDDKKQAAEDLEGAESQSYGYGYGTKVQDKYSTSTVYVHGFGSDEGPYGPYDGPAPHYKGYNYKAPVYHPNGYESGYGYGSIDGYGNAKHGYGYEKNHGYHGKSHGHGYGHHGPSYGGHSQGYGYSRGPAYHGRYHDPYARADHYSHSFGYGYGNALSIH